VPNLGGDGGDGGVLKPGGGGGGVPNREESSLMGAHYYLNAGGVGSGIFGSGRSFKRMVQADVQRARRAMMVATQQPPASAACPIESTLVPEV
jgi:hypothetical protein